MSEPIATMNRGKVITQGIREIVTAATCRLGTRKDIGLGRVFVYVRFGTAGLSAGNLLQMDTPCFTAAFNALYLSVTAAKGDKSVQYKNTADTSIAADYFKDGFFWVSNSADCGDGSGYIYRIKGHLSANTSDTSVTVHLHDEIAESLTSAMEVSFQKNMFDDAKAVAAAVGCPPLGVTVVSVGCSAKSYGWIQIKGEACVKAGAVGSIGEPIYIATAAGQVEQQSAGKSGVESIGYLLQTAATSEFCLCYLDIL